MTSMLLLGFLIGLRHAVEADHLAAVASMARGGESWRSSVVRGAVWGLGHTLTLLLVGGLCLALGATIPAPLARSFEAAVGLMLVVLGFQVLRRLRRRRVHIHLHRHDDGAVHLHAHSHADGHPHDAPEAHDHPHPPGSPFRALGVGLVHGLAGSAALVLLTLETTGGAASGLAYIALFGIGSIAGMALLSAVISVPLRAGERLASGLLAGLEGTIGAVTLLLGIQVLVRQLSM